MYLNILSAETGKKVEFEMSRFAVSILDVRSPRCRSFSHCSRKTLQLKINKRRLALLTPGIIRCREIFPLSFVPFVFSQARKTRFSRSFCPSPGSSGIPAVVIWRPLFRPVNNAGGRASEDGECLVNLLLFFDCSECA